MTPHSPIHATCVSFNERAVLIVGKSGRGKSALGLTLMAMGCSLVADDQVILENRNQFLVARCPQAIQGMIEARGVGLLNATFLPQANVTLVVDLDEAEAERLPKRRVVTLLGCEIPLIHFYEGAHFAPAILQHLKAGRSDE